MIDFNYITFYTVFKFQLTNLLNNVHITLNTEWQILLKFKSIIQGQEHFAEKGDADAERDNEDLDNQVLKHVFAVMINILKIFLETR